MLPHHQQGVRDGMQQPLDGRLLRFYNVSDAFAPAVFDKAKTAGASARVAHCEPTETSRRFTPGYHAILVRGVP